MKTIELLENYKAEILEKLEQHVEMFKLIGHDGSRTGVNESPRYYNVGGFDEEFNTIKFRSTQSSKLGFDIYIKEEDRKHPAFWQRLKLDNQVIWNWFKEVRTNYLIENHPTVDAY
jgi:hypothetical protein